MLFSAVVREEASLEAVGHWYPNSQDFLVTCSVPLDLLSYPNSCLSPRTSPIWPPVTKGAAYRNHAHSGTSFFFRPVIPLLALSVFLLLSLFLCFLACQPTSPSYCCSIPPPPKIQYPSSLLEMLEMGRVLPFASLLPARRSSVRMYMHECAPAQLCLCTCLYCEERNRYRISPRRSQRCKSFVGLKGPTRLC